MNERRELVNGRAFLSPAPDARAEELTDALYLHLSRFSVIHRLGTAYRSPESVILSDRDIFQPSVVFFRNGRDARQGGVLKGVPDLIVEVKTDSTPDDPLGPKTDRCRDLKVPEFWLVSESELWGTQRFHAQGWEFNRWVMFAMDPIIRSVALPGLELRVADVFGEGR